MPLFGVFTGCLTGGGRPAASQQVQAYKSCDLADNEMPNGTLYGGQNLSAGTARWKDSLWTQLATDTSSTKRRSYQDSVDSPLASGSFAISAGIVPATSSIASTTWTSDASTDSSPRSVLAQSVSESSLLARLPQSLRQKQKLRHLSSNQLLGLGSVTAKAAAAVPAAAKAPAALTAAGPHANSLAPCILQHGHGIMSLSTLQTGLKHFVVPGVGYIAYAMMYNGPPVLNIRTAVALGDPICASADYAGMAAAFLEQHPKAMFMQVSGEFAAVLQQQGMLVNSVGGETQLDLEKYTFSGYAKRGLRSAISSAEKEGITVEEVMQAPGLAASETAAGNTVQDWSRLVAEMQEVDRLWVNAKGKQAGRVWFLNRLPVFAPEAGVRKFIARDRNGRLEAFIFYDAVYEDGKVVGYYANVTRMRPAAHPGVMNLLVKTFIDRVRTESQLAAPAKKLSIKKSQLKKQLQQQQQSDTAAPADTAISPTAAGATSSTIKAPKFLSLGLSPFHQLDDSSFKHSSGLKALLEFAYKHGSGFYPFKSLAAAKAKYGAGLHNFRYEDGNVTYKQVYLAHSHHNNATAAVAMFDFGVMLGFWSNPADAAAGLLAYKTKRRIRLLRQGKQGTVKHHHH